MATRRSDRLKTIPVTRTGPWSPHEDAIVRRDDITLVEMAFMLGRSHSSVCSRRRKLKTLDEPDVPHAVDEAEYGVWRQNRARLAPPEQKLLRDIGGLIGRGLTPKEAYDKVIRKEAMKYDGEQPKYLEGVLKALTKGFSRAYEQQTVIDLAARRRATTTERKPQ